MDEYIITVLEEARSGALEGGIPIGAVLVNVQGTVVATGRNRRLQEGADHARGDHLPVDRTPGAEQLPVVPRPLIAGLSGQVAAQPKLRGY